MSKLHLFLFFLLASMPLLAVVRASDNEESDDSSSSDSSSSSSAGEPEDSTTEDDSEMNQNADVVTSFHFPADPAHRRFQAGSVITLLVGLKNNGNQYLNVSSLGGHLLSPYDIKFGIQNYTRREYGVVVPPGREGTFEYTFRPDKSLEANEYPFIVDMLYFSTKKAYRSVPFNHTIELEEPHSIVNTIGGPTFTLLLAFGGLAYYLLVVRAGSSKKSAKPAAAATETGTAAAVVDDWGLKKMTPVKKTPTKKA